MQTCPEAEMIDQTSTYMFALAGDLEDIFAADADGAESPVYFATSFAELFLLNACSQHHIIFLS